MSASYHVDLGNTALFVPSVSVPAANSLASGSNYGLSGAVIGQWIDCRNANSFCNIYVAMGATSGPIQLQVQCAEGPWDIPLAGNAFSGNVFSGGAPASGSFTDPTSGLAQLPTWFSSGGVLIVNSGLYTNPGALGASGQQVGGYAQGTLPFGNNPIQNAMGGSVFVASGTYPVFASGGIAIGGFQRPYQYLRINVLSGATTYPYLQAGVISQLMTTGSGGGFVFSPLGGTVNV